MRLRRFLPSPAMLVAVTALVLSLGGSAYALVVTGKTIRNNSVTNADIRQRTLTGNDMRRDKVGGGSIKESSLGTVSILATVSIHCKLRAPDKPCQTAMGEWTISHLFQ